MRIAGNTMQQAIDAEKDIFERDQFAGGLLNLFESSDDPLVVALDEKWGTGKTVFSKRLKKRAEDEGFKVVYFDAFKRDYDPDVFIALSAELLAKFPANTREKSSLKESAKAVGKTIGKLALKGGVRLLTAGAISAADVGDAAEEAANEIGNLAEAELDALIDRRLDSARLADETFAQFKASLEKLATPPREENQQTETPQEAKPLLFIVDELDRCRPDYALSVLETVKHFFSVRNVHFLLVCDIDQLVAAVHHRYGIEGHGYTYLEKFIDVRISFPVLAESERKIAIGRFIYDFRKGMPSGQGQDREWQISIDFLSNLALNHNYSLRRIEKIITQFAISIHFLNKNSYVQYHILSLLCDLKISNSKLYKKAKSGTLNYSEIMENYNKNGTIVINEKLGNLLQFFYDKDIDIEDPKWDRYKTISWQGSFESFSEIPIYLANQVVDKIG